MKKLSAYVIQLKTMKDQHGFTMIELLIVIAILGILAVAVLSAINPVEQINRGRDTGSRSDAEQFLSAIDRFNAFQGYYPWQEDENDADLEVVVGETIQPVDNDLVVHSDDLDMSGCTVLERLSIGDEDVTGCVNSQELKQSFVTRIVEDARQLYIYNEGGQGDSTYVCFVPQSGAFETEAEQRCADGLPADLLPIVNEICNGNGAGTAGARSVIQEGDAAAICLP